ncbi:MAG: response regulator transcription factor [Gemmatimonadales bacterium]|jgi:DNA-binding response OmpR family regulator
MSSILIIEDNADLAFGLQAALEVEGYAVRVAGDGHQGLEQAQRWSPDLVVLDLMLPGIDGYKVLKELRANGHDMPVMILTARGEEADKVLGFNIGADDYVTKPFGVLELLARVKALLRRSSEAAARDAPAVERVGEDVVVNFASRTVRRGDEEIPLTPKEFDLLEALIRRRGAAVSRVELLKEVWDYSASVMTRTVDMHIAELRKKLEPDPTNPQHILTVRKVGYRLEA